MMDPEQFEEIMRSVIAEPKEAEPGTGPRFVLPIKAFRATDSHGRELEVVGVTGTEDDNENLSFIVLADLDDNGETYPIIESSVWRIKKKAA
ncbi:MAG: hypothetical protein E5Y73_09665 [Mesorhizobium sp.]|uniref:hypothetical protein n=1 Tax=Mesorhizobium sp. TaxID=1871066 RepID=UPI001216B1B2|nr:hypothetical protein [Mesorhizobium sp.]TIL94792.1 MAG: hypothetical protein E5Y73_09665 [Mesorhizobium sp.]